MQPVKRKYPEFDSLENESKRRKLTPISMPIEMWHETIRRSLTSPPRELLSKYSVVCKPWLECCLKIKKELLIQGDHVCNVFSSFAKSKISPTGFFGDDALRILFNEWQSIRVLNLSACALNNAQLHFLSCLTFLERLDLSDCCNVTVPAGLLTEAGSEQLAKLENLKSLDLVNWEAGLQFIQSLTNLQSLNIHNASISGEIEFLTRLTQLEKFKFDGIGIEDFAFLANFTKLKELDCNDINDSGLKAIANLNTLEIISIPYSKITNKALPFLSNALSLRSLDISDTHIDDPESIQLLGRLTNLTQLSLSGIDLNNMDLSFILNLKQLTDLDLTYTDIGLQALKYIAACTTLRSLEIGGRNAGLLNAIEGVELLTHLIRLTNLEIHSTDITAEGLKLLSSLTNLRDLNMRFSEVHGDDTYMEALSHTTSLKSIHLGNDWNISDAGLMHLTKLTCLRQLEGLQNPTKLGKAFLARLLAAAVFNSSDITQNGYGYLHYLPFQAWWTQADDDKDFEAAIQ